jgi:anti-sigma B factor antagonist
VKANSSQREVRDGTLTIRLSEDATGCTLALAGELDLANAETLADMLEHVRTGGGPVRIDLSRLEFIDSTGIALLVATHRKFAGGDRLSLVRSRTMAVRRVMTLTGLDAALPFTPNGYATTER